MAEIDEEWIKRRNEFLLQDQDQSNACWWGKLALRHSRPPEEFFCCASFLEHVRNRDCQQCAELLENAGKKAQKAMGY